MESLVKPFWQSKIMWAAFINFIFSMVFVWTGNMIDPIVLEALPDMVANTISQKTTLMMLNGVVSIFIMLSRAAFQPGTKPAKFWKSIVFWGAIVTFIINVVNFTTGVEIPADLEGKIISVITEILTTGDILASLEGIIGIGILIFKIFFTNKEAKTALKPVFVSVGLMKSAA